MGEKDSFLDYVKEIPNFLSIFIVPIYFMTVTPMLIEMSKSTGISSGDLSLIITFFTIGLVAGQLTSVFYNKKFSKIKIILVSYIFIIFLIIILSFVSNLYLFYILYFFLGYTAGVIWLQATKYILENKINNKDRLTTIFLSFYPIGNMVAPFIASSLIDNNLNWRYSYYIMAGIAFIILISYMFIKRDWRGKVQHKEELISIKKIFVNRKINIIFFLGCLLLFLYCISETVIAVWAPTFLRVEKLFDIQFASLAVSIFWLSSFAGRMIVSFFAGKIKTNYILFALSIIAIVSMIVFIPLKTATSSLIAIGFAGLGHSAIITLGISSASTVYVKGRGILASIVFAAVNAGVSIAPFLTRYVSKSSMTLSVMLAPIFMGLTSLVIIWKIIFENKYLKDGEIPG